MSIFNDIAAYMGIPAGGITAAAAIYSGCIIAEREAKKEALADIHEHVFQNELSQISLPNVMKRIFNYTFGLRHFSARCFFASAFATLCFVAALSLQFSLTTDIYPQPQDYIAGGVYIFLITVIIIDYASLYKSRRLIYLASTLNIPVFLFVLADLIITSIILFVVSYSLKSVISGELINIHRHLLGYFTVMTEDVLYLFSHDMDTFPLDAVAITSTYLTTLWTFLMTLSAYIIKFISPIQRLVCWYFDTKEHPIRSIGFVASVFVLIGSLIWSLI